MSVGDRSPPRLPATLWGFLTACVVCLPRIGPVAQGKYLWAEDGPVFMTQAFDQGLTSILSTYAGYLHVFPRLVALGTTPLPLPAKAIAYLVAWLVCVYLLTRTILRCGTALGISRAALLVLIALVFLQPNNGEVFFNLTNAQWLLGLALTLLVVSWNDRKPDPIDLIVLALGVTTGPFALLLAPFVLIGVRRQKDGIHRVVAALVLAAAIVQGWLVLTSRLDRGALASDASSVDTLRLCVKTFLRTLVFWEARWDVVVAALAFWISLLLVIVRDLADPAVRASRNFRLALLLFAIGAFELVVAIVVQWTTLHYYGDLDQTRYSFIPCSLFLVAALLLTGHHRVTRWLSFAMFGYVSLRLLHPIDLVDVQFASFDAFAQVEEVSIPVNPRRPPLNGFDDWDIAGRSVAHKGARHASAHAIPSSRIGFVRGDPSTGAGPRAGPYFQPDERIQCGDAKTVGMRIALSATGRGGARLFWTPSGDFAAAPSLVRFHDARTSRVDFAFPNEPRGFDVRLVPSGKDGRDLVTGWTVYCIG